MQNKKSIILYIEDDGMLMNMYKDLFTTHGFDFVGAKNFTDGKKLIEKSNPNIILLDLLLPDKSEWIPTELNVDFGIELLKKIKNNPKTADIPVIILSNIDESNIVEDAKKFGADDYMIKANVLPKEVLAKVQKILKKHNIELPCDPIKQKCE